MKLDTEEPEEIQLNMTAMIDIVFQLLIFFIMTFKVVAQEADFNIKMPLASGPATDILEAPPTRIRVSLRSGAEGVINSIQVDDDVETLTFGPDPNLYLDLTDYIEQKLAGEGDPESAKKTEVEFDIDYGLRYGYTVRAIEAVSGKVSGGKVKKLIENIKFKNKSNEQ